MSYAYGLFLFSAHHWRYHFEVSTLGQYLFPFLAQLEDIQFFSQDACASLLLLMRTMHTVDCHVARRQLEVHILLAIINHEGLFDGFYRRFVIFVFEIEI
jgi:hypothetical protein